MGFSITSVLMLFTLISFVLLLLASIKLLLARNIPGSRLIFISLIGTMLSVFLPEAETDEGDIIMLWQIVEISAEAILMLMASYGFYRLSGFVAKNAADKPVQEL